MELDTSVKVESSVFDDVSMECYIKDEIEVEEEIFHRGATYNEVLTNYEHLIAEIPRLCSICDKIFPNSYSFLQHNIIHLKIPLEKLHIKKDTSIKNQYQCKYCGIRIKSIANFRRHIKNKHTNINLVKCKYCDVLFKQWYLKTHIEKVHAPNKFQCDLCLKKFMSTAAMENHKLYIHNKIYLHSKTKGDLIFKCDVCQYLFKRKQDLQTHLKSHDNNKIQCDKCNAVLKTKQILRNHYRWVHHDEGKMYSCNICEKKFRTPYHLQTHSKNSHKPI